MQQKIKMATRGAWFTISLVFLLNYFVYCEEATESNAPSSTPSEDDHVLVLTANNFEDVTKSSKIILVEFYAPWCGHCQALAPQYSLAAEQLKKNDPPIPLAKVDCTTDKAICDSNGVGGYPTLKLFHNGESVEYDGPRVSEGIIKYMKEKGDPNWKPPPLAVLTLTEKNFDEITKREEIMLVEFYAPWCGHCKKLAPHLEKAAQVLSKRENRILIGQVDATVEKAIAERYNVEGYPTMFLFRKGQSTKYEGPREEPGISDYIITREGDATELVETLQDVKNFIKKPMNDDPVILAVVESKEDPIYKLYVSANNEIREDFSFGHTFSKDVRKYFNLKKSAILIIHAEHIRTKHEPQYHAFDDEGGSPTEVLEFYKRYRCPLVGHFQKSNAKMFERRPLVLVFYDVNFSPAVRSLTEFWRKKVITVAKDHPDMLFAVANEESFDDRLKDFGLSESGEDVNFGIYDDKGYRYAAGDEEFSEDTLGEFIKTFKSGDLTPMIKSEFPARKANAGEVQVVTGYSFQEIVMDETKEVFIEFYAPWCGHCRAIEEYIEKLAVNYKDEKNIIIAKMDGTMNEGPSQYPFSGFPTIYYSVPGNKNDPIKLTGKRDMAALTEFVEKNSVILKNKTDKKKDEL